MENTNSNRFDILNGASKYDYHLSHSFRESPHQRVRFKIKYKDGMDRDIHVDIIASIKIHSGDEHGEGHLWFFHGDCDVCGEERVFPHGVRGAYSTRTRTGWVEGISKGTKLALYAAFGAVDEKGHHLSTGYILPRVEKHKVA